MKIDTVARMGGNWYSRAKSGIFEVPKPLSTMGIGVDALPDSFLKSNVLTGNDLGMLGNVENLPSEEDVETFVSSSDEYKDLITSGNIWEIHKKAQEFLQNKNVMKAWKLLLAK